MHYVENQPTCNCVDVKMAFLKKSDGSQQKNKQTKKNKYKSK